MQKIHKGKGLDKIKLPPSPKESSEVNMEMNVENPSEKESSNVGEPSMSEGNESETLPQHGEQSTPLLSLQSSVSEDIISETLPQHEEQSRPLLSLKSGLENGDIIISDDDEIMPDGQFENSIEPSSGQDGKFSVGTDSLSGQDKEFSNIQTDVLLEECKTEETPSEPTRQGNNLKTECSTSDPPTQNTEDVERNMKIEIKDGGERVFTCRICDKLFKQRSNVTDHIKSVHFKIR